VGEKDTRRAGDDTRQRIDRLAGGWEVPEGMSTGAAADEPPPPPPPPERAKAASRPPPPPPPRPPRPTAPPPPPAPPAVAAPSPPPAIAVAAATSAPAPEPLTIASERTDPTERDDATRVDPRGDATVLAAAERAAATAGGSLPPRAAFRRQRGWTGDVAYVATVAFRSAAARRELARLEASVETTRKARTQLLIALGAEAVGQPDLAGAAVAAARTALAAIEDERAARAGAAAAADAEADAIARTLRAELDHHRTRTAELEAELAALAGRLAPLDKEVAAVRKRGDALRATLAKQDDALRALEARCAAMRGKSERAAVEAELATVRADRVAIARDEPALAAQLDELTPRVAALEAERATVRERLAETAAAARRAQARADDELAAVAAQQKVVARDVEDLGRRRDRALSELGAELALSRPPSLAAAQARLDDADAAAAEEQRRAIELREMLDTIDRGAVARGVAILALVAFALCAVVFFLVR
jgi:predicted  nucleic acid-binding Zn-ribbon protein